MKHETQRPHGLPLTHLTNNRASLLSTSIAIGTSSANWAVTGFSTNPANATDFGGTLPSGTVNFAAGETSQTITVNVSGDTMVESDEGFTVTLSNSNNATIATATATGTITNDDTQVTLTVSPSSVAEDGTPNLVYTFTRTGPTTNTLAVNYTIGGTATNNTVSSFLIVNDGVGGFNPATDLVINLTGYSSNLPGLGNIAVGSLFV